jgi:hypothetical protein
MTNEIIKVLRPTGKTLKEKCSFGDVHSVEYLERVTLQATGDTLFYNNGYERRAEKVYVTETGERYHSVGPTDYASRPYFVKIEESGPRLVYPNSIHFGRDLAGNPLNERTPPGPTYAEAFAEDLARVEAEYEEHMRLKGKS